ncbi:hypothetical protein BDA99DRAFT_557084 [Phascolomyces articulosus]|uniref:Uncharacterized protein n=1 Tax=Phascolomyces articulosus TaxID=60185 RepID=A0AAD5K6U2_9FUNG|nr:hypothetical protein BDA99DRAFT_557084 [Phascolomyces articulosus]
MGFVLREPPSYDQHLYIIKFRTENERQSWSDNNPQRHAVLVRNGTTKSNSSNSKINGRPAEDEKKFYFIFGCTARIDLFKIFDISYVAAYYWGRINHDPTNQYEIIASRLPENARSWVANCVDKNMDWLDENPNIFPVSELIEYKDVQNLILTKLAHLSKKAPLDKDSI